MTFADIFNHARKFASDNSPAILTGVAVAGVVTTAVLTGKASIKAAELIHEDILEKKDALPEGERYFREYKENVKLVWKEFIPPVVAGCATITCIVMANQIGTRRAAAVASALTVGEKAFAEYKEKVVEKLGEKKERDIRDEIVQDRVNNNPPSSTQVIITGSGDHLCYDMYSGRYFLSNMETLKKAQNDTNYQILGDSYASLTDFYQRLGLRPTQGSDDIGWTADCPQLELQFTSVLSEEQKPCLAFSFNVTPFAGFYHGHR